MLVDPVKLVGKICVCTTYFNPLGLSNKHINFNIFRDALWQQGAELAVIENVIGNRQPDLDEGDANWYLRVEGGDTLWQKERLMNLLVKQLPKHIDKIIFCDADILFNDNQWLYKASELLDSYRIIQPFSHCIRLPEGAQSIDVAQCDIGHSTGEINHSFALGFNAYKTTDLEYSFMGSAGFSWGYRRRVIEECPFYENMIVGGGDTMMAYSYAGRKKRVWAEQNLSTKLVEDFNVWKQQAAAAGAQSMGVVPGTIFHLWHGDPKHRQYIERQLILQDEDYDPVLDVNAPAGQPLRWASQKPQLHQKVVDYFCSRQESV